MHEIRVLYLTSNPNRQSSLIPTEGWILNLKSKGLKPIVAYNQIGDFCNWCLSQNIPAYQVELTAPGYKNLLPSILRLSKLIFIIVRHRIQIIHCNEQNIYPIGKYLALICRLPIITSVHFSMSKGFCEWAFKWRKPDRMFFVSKANQDACNESLVDIVPCKNMIVLKNGIDLNFFKPDLEIANEFRNKFNLGNTKLIGAACALREVKQLEHLFKAANILQNEDMKVIVAGVAVPGNEEYGNELMRTAKAMLGDRLVFLGHLNDLRGFMNALDLYINTSIDEACSISIIQALAVGCPIVGYPSNSTVSEQVLPEAGEIVPQNNIPALAVAIHKYLNNQNLLKNAKLAARSKVLLEYDISKQSDMLLIEYKKILNLY